MTSLSRRAVPLLLALVALGLAAACSDGIDEPDREPTAAEALQEQFSGIVLDEPWEKPDFTLTDTDGNPYDFRRQTEGQIVLLYFGYTSCPDVCPVHIANISQAIDRSPAVVERSVQVVFVGVDAPRDTPERVREWLDFFDRDYIGLSGSQSALDAAQLAAGVPLATRDESDEGDEGDDPDRYTVSHAGWVMLYTPDGLAHLRYPLGIRQSQWSADLTRIVTEGWWGS